MADVPLDTQERLELCDLLDELGPSVPTLLEGWTAHDLAAHIVLRERDLVAGPCIVLPGPFQRFAERRRARLAQSKDFTWLVTRIRSGPPIGFFRIGWVRALANLNEFFVHAPASVHESCDLSANFDDTVDGNRCVSVNLGAMSSKNSTQVLPCCRGWKGSWRVVRPHRAFANPLFTVSRLISFSRLYGVRVGQASVAFPITFGRR
jgi:hypothetical protein